MKGIYLRKILPALAKEIKDALARMDMPDIASQVDELKIYKRCDCASKFCSSFYTSRKKSLDDVIVLDTDLELNPEIKVNEDVTFATFREYPQKFIFLHVDKKRNIGFVEVLFKPEINAVLDEKVYKVEKIS